MEPDTDEYGHPKCASVSAASALLGTAMRDTETPVMAMACALARISNLLAASGAAAGPGAGHRDCIENDISICIESLQFHDRLIQQLTAVRRLMGAQSMEGEQGRGFMPAAGTIELF